MDYLTFLETVPERTRPAHGAGFLIQRHAGVSEAAVAAGVKGDFLISQAVVALAGEVHLTCRGRTGRCEKMQIAVNVDGHAAKLAGCEYMNTPSVLMARMCAAYRAVQS